MTNKQPVHDLYIRELTVEETDGLSKFHVLRDEDHLLRRFGQVQVISDLLGLFADFVPKHAKQYAKLAGSIRTAIADYMGEVKSGSFPTAEHSSTIDESLLEELASS